jgi:hypothetical protein
MFSLRCKNKQKEGRIILKMLKYSIMLEILSAKISKKNERLLDVRFFCRFIFL